MFTNILILIPIYMCFYSAMIICAVSSHWYGKEKLAVVTRVLCWITGIAILPNILAGGIMGFIALAACYACYRVSERVRYKFRTPQIPTHPDYGKILDAGLD